MTVTISRLYDSYAQVTEAVSNLEKAGLPYRDISIVSNDGERARYEAILDRSAVNLRDRGALWRREGWQRFDPNASPYTADEIRKQRDAYRGPGGSLGS
jgi:hypothetical protein